MSLLQDYSITCNASGNYSVNFTTTEKASVTYTTDPDGTNVITLNTYAKGETSFVHNFGNSGSDLKFLFDQPAALLGRLRKPNGDIIGV